MNAVTLEKIGRVALITFNQAKKLNSMSEDIANGFSNIVDLICSNPFEYGCVVITGRGRAFSAGGDLDWLRSRGTCTPTRNGQIMSSFYQKFLKVRQIPLPVIAAINGAAIGAGLCFAMACDIRIASKQAKLGFTFVSLGLHPGMGATHLIASIAGYEIAYKVLLSGELYSGAEAKEMHLVSRTAPDGPSTLKMAMQLANTIASQGSAAVQATVRSLRQKQDEGLNQALLREADAQACGYSTHDFKEGIDAIASKRKPKFLMHESGKEDHIHQPRPKM